MIVPGDKIKLIELDEEFGDKWYYGKNMQTGQEGLFPSRMRPSHATEEPLANARNSLC